jgi:soluble lytic murein transglycosylase
MKKLVILSIIMIGIVIATIIFIVLFFPKKHGDLIETYSSKYGLNKSMVASVINIESGYDSSSVSDAGAMGLMQILPSTANDCASRLKMDIKEEDLYNPDINIEIGCFYLSYLLDMFDGNEVNALCAYNWGLGNVNNWIERGNVDENGTITKIPVLETRNYVKKYKVSNFVYKNIYKFDSK